MPWMVIKLLATRVSAFCKTTLSLAKCMAAMRRLSVDEVQHFHGASKVLKLLVARASADGTVLGSQPDSWSQ